MSDDFDWYDLDDDTIVVHPPPGFAIYRNNQEQVVIRQKGLDYDDDDPFVFFAPEHATAIVQGILREVGLEATGFRSLSPSQEEPLLQLPAPRSKATVADSEKPQVEMSFR